MKKIVMLSVIAASLMAGEFQFGKGTFTLDNGNGVDLSTDVTTFSLVEQHSNLFSSNWFYSYDITWNESENANNATNSTEYKFQGIDLNFVLGKDLVHNSDDDFVGLGVVLGASFPWIDSEDNTNTANNINNTANKTKTKIMTYKIGPTINVRKPINNYLMVYANATYAYQTGSVKNDDLNIDSNANGTFLNYGIGIRFQPFSAKKDIGFMTLDTKLYFTLGYKYNKWVLKDVSLNSASASGDLKMSTSVVYAGVGYSF